MKRFTRLALCTLALCAVVIIVRAAAIQDHFRDIQTIAANDQQQRQYITGPRGGCYYINSNGNKTYVDKSFCAGTAKTTSSSNKNNEGSYGTSSPSSSGRQYQRGPKGGCYYINASGNKVYVSRDLCN